MHPNRYLYSLIGAGIIIALVAGFFFYKRNAVISCTIKAAYSLEKETGAPITQGKDLYDVLYRICMGRKGFSI